MPGGHVVSLRQPSGIILTPAEACSRAQALDHDPLRGPMVALRDAVARTDIGAAAHLAEMRRRFAGFTED